MNLGGLRGVEFYIILGEQRDRDRNRLRTRSLQAGWIDYSMNNLKKIVDLVEASYSKVWPTVGCEKILQEAFGVYNPVFPWEPPWLGWRLCIKINSYKTWFSCISVIGGGRVFYCFKMHAKDYQKA